MNKFKRLTGLEFQNLDGKSRYNMNMGTEASNRAMGTIDT